MFKNYTFYVLIVCVLIFSCEKKSTKSCIKTINLKESNEVKKISLSDLDIQDIKYVPLETNSESLLTSIQEVFCDGEYYFLTISSSVLKFDLNGSFLMPIGKEGKGPGEFLDCTDVSFDPKTKKIYILCTRLSKVFIYNYQGHFIKTIKTPRGVTSISCIQNGVLFYCINMDGSVEDSFYIYDEDGLQIKAFPNKYKFDYRRYGVFFPYECLSYEWQGNVFIKEIYSDTILSLKNNHFSPETILDRGGKTFPVSAKNDMKDFGDMQKVTNKYVIDYKLLRFGRYLYLEYGYHGTAYLVLYDFKKEVHHISKLEEGISNDYDNGLKFYPKNGFGSNHILSWFSAIDLKAHVASKVFQKSTPNYPEKKKQLIKLANSLTENDNPVLMLVKLKE